MPFEFKKLDIADVVVITPRYYPDERGGFSETFKQSEFLAAGLEVVWRQINWSTSKKDVVRGMHYQLMPYQQGKLVSVVRGIIYDAVIDIRRSSSTYGQWVGVELDAEKREMVWVPPGFAHGFCVLSEEADVIYYCTAEYSPESERGIIWNDPTVGITWPTQQPILSDKDKVYPTLAAAETNF